eukprot:GHVT01104525.1.p4 GENE.GHVT01104525.1~~GHVT01104525.1.p4  ORF type:complete len:150 (-),score=16.37 GHVT01104525.1:4636-5085(-)
MADVDASVTNESSSLAFLPVDGARSMHNAQDSLSQGRRKRACPAADQSENYSCVLAVADEKIGLEHTTIVKNLDEFEKKYNDLEISNKLALPSACHHKSSIGYLPSSFSGCSAVSSGIPVNRLIERVQAVNTFQERRLISHAVSITSEA